MGMTTESSPIVKLILDDGSAVELAEDNVGYVARHDGQVFHLTATVTGPMSISPAKWCATR